MEWVETSGSSVSLAVEVALVELGLTSPEQAVIEVLQEPKPGFLGIGKQDAVVKVMRKQSEKPAKRRRRRRGRSEAGGEAGDRPRRSAGESGSGRDRGTPGARRSGNGRRKEGDQRRDGSRGGGQRGGDSGSPSTERKEQAAMEPHTPETEAADIGEQAEVAEAFLRGLLGAFGLEGEVTSRVDDDTLYLDVSGEQTEALVGTKGVVMQAVLEVTRTVVQRKTFGAPRMRLDIAGYAERRREALTIYTRKLAERVLAERGEVMLEPMNAADRKVVHDTVADIEGVRSYSEGEEPERAVVIAPAVES